MNRSIICLSLAAAIAPLSGCTDAYADWKNPPTKPMVSSYGTAHPEPKVTQLQASVDVVAKLAKERRPPKPEELIAAGLCPLDARHAFKRSAFKALPTSVQVSCVQASRQWRADVWAFKRIIMKERNAATKEAPQKRDGRMVAQAGG